MMKINQTSLIAAISSIGLICVLRSPRANPQGPSVPAVIRAHSFVVEDGENRSRCRIGTSSKGTPIIQMLDKDGRTTASIISDDDYGTAIEVRGVKRSIARISLGPDGTPYILLEDANGKEKRLSP